LEAKDLIEREKKIYRGIEKREGLSWDKFSKEERERKAIYSFWMA